MSESEISIVIVDDDATVPRLLELALPTQAADVRIVGSAADGAAARAAVDAKPPDVVVIDHTLPDLTGIELGRALAAEHAGMGLVLWTGTRSDELRLEAEAAGFGAVVTKSGDLHELITAIRLVAAGS
ncbi:MAG: response regulator transcription factor [Acidimicrobiia bacterium]|nr:response regulator transcription factor [Acidimicrobiia bacterium]